MYEHFQPITTIFLRLIFSSILLWVIIFVTRQGQVVSKADFKLFLMVALFEPFLYFIGESFGIRLVSSTVAAVIVSTIPLFTPVAAYIFLREKLSWLSFSGILVSLFGVALVALGDGEGFSASITGIALMFFAVLSAIAYSVALKKVASRYNPFFIVAMQNSIGSIYFLPLLLGLEGEHVLHLQFVPGMVIPLFNLTFFASTLAFICWVIAVNRIGVNKASVFINLIPVITAIFAFILLGDSLNGYKIAGVLIAVSGLFLAQLKSGIMLPVRVWINKRKDVAKI